MEPTADSLRLRSIAERVVESLDEVAKPRAGVITGSAGAGVADRFSDLDLMTYYDGAPADDMVRRWHSTLGVCTVSAARTEWGWNGTFVLEGVECQVAAFEAQVVERDVEQLLSGIDPGHPGRQKTALGLLHGHVLRDDGLIANWRSRLCAFPDTLANAMASYHLTVFPIWSYHEMISHRDAHLWATHELVEGAFHILGGLSAANRQYFTSFQSKRMRDHIAFFTRSPDDLARRLESLLDDDLGVAALSLRQLVLETVEIIESELPQVDTSAVRASLRAT